MNIFHTSKSPRLCAQALDDLRLNKMIVETAQILSTVVRSYEIDTDLNLYKPTHANHPCVVWAGSGRQQFFWLLVHGHALLAERYLVRFPDKKAHASGAVIDDVERWFRLWGQELLPDVDFAPPPNCTPHKDLELCEAYRRTLSDKWASDVRAPRWTHRGEPSWA